MNINFAELAVQIPVLLFALTLHEVAHGYVAFRLGDPTAKQLGRLSLNPLKHLDPIGTIAFILIKFGWAKPVPVNPNYFRNPRRDMLLVALAGPLTNLVLALVCAILIKAMIAALPFLPQNAVLAAVLTPMLLCLTYSVWINVILCIFNFIPIPPLDGSKILMGVLPYRLAVQYAKFEQYSFILVFILAYSGKFSKLIAPIVHGISSWLLPS